VAQQPTAVGAVAEGSILAFRSPTTGAALEADSGGGSRWVISGCYSRRVSLALVSAGAKRHHRSRALSVSRFPEMPRVIVSAQSQKRHRGAWNAI
jgi:hypothetical protein